MAKMNIGKVAFAVILTSLTTFNAEARLFNGASIGGNAGVMFSQDRLGKTDIDGISLKFKGKNKTLGNFGIQGDFEMSRVNALYGALGVSLNFLTNIGSKTSSFTNVNGLLGSGNTLNNISLKFKVHQNIVGDFTFAGGYNFCDNLVVYALAGFRITTKKYKFTFTEIVTDVNFNTTTTTYVRTKKQEVIPILGAGFKARVTPKISTGFEYKYTYKNKKKYSIKAPVISGKLKSYDHAILARASYHFYSL